VTTVPIPICYSCANLYVQGELRSPPLRCTAFPEAIPEDILESEADHRLPHAGDHGIVFVQHPDRLEPDWSVFDDDDGELP